MVQADWPLTTVSPDVAFWRPVDTNGDHVADLEHVANHNGSLRVETFVSDVAPDEVTEMHSVLGARTLVAYELTSDARNVSRVNAPASGCWLPAGTTRRVADAVYTSDGLQASSNVTYAYQCPVWSVLDRRMIGFQSVASDERAAVNRPKRGGLMTYDLSDGCGARLLQRTAGSAQESAVSTRRFVPAGSAPPYHCETSQLDESEVAFDGSTADRQTKWEYDVLGVPVVVRNLGDPNVANDDRTTFRSVQIGSAPFIVTLAHEWSVDALGNSVRDTEYTSYDGAGRLKSKRQQIDANRSATTSYDYDACGNASIVWDDNGHITTTDYDPVHCEYAVKTTRAKGTAQEQSRQTHWSYVYGKPAYVIDENGVQQDTRAYDALGRLSRRQTADGGLTTYGYFDVGVPGSQRVETTVADGSNDGLWTRTWFDGLGRTTSVSRKGAGVNGPSSRDVTYADVSSNVYKASHWYDGHTPRVEDTWSYDDRNRALVVIRADGTQASTQYPARRSKQFDEAGHEVDRLFDAFGEILAVTEWNQGAQNTTHYKYDGAGRLRQTQNANGNLAVIDWDLLGRKVGETDGDIGVVKYGYDGVGNLLTRVDGRGVEEAYAYDALDRVVAMSNSQNDRRTEWVYDEGNFGIGRLTAILDSRVNCPAVQYGGASLYQQIQYDALGRIVTDSRCIDGSSTMVGMRYDTLSRLQAVRYPDNETVTYGYDAAGRLASAGTYATQITYDAADKLLSDTLGNGVTEIYQYSPQREWLISAAAQSGGRSIYSSQYTYYQDGLVHTSNESGQASANDPMLLSLSASRGFHYDGVHRLTDVSGTWNGQLIQEHYEYDPIGNITTKWNVGGYQYGTDVRGCAEPCAGGPRAVSRAGAASYGYDKAGNMLVASDPRSTRTFQWDEVGRMAHATTQPAGTLAIGANTLQVDLLYAPGRDGERIRKTVTGGNGEGTTRYFGRYLEQTPQGTWVKYYYAGPRLIAHALGPAGIFYHHQDRLGSTRAVTDAAGNVIPGGLFDNDSFGARKTGDSKGADHIEFTGMRRDGEITDTLGEGGGLVYMNARYYDSVLGRFISADSIVPNAFAPQSRNRYSYVTNNPIASVDPTGHDEAGSTDAPPNSSDFCDVANQTVYMPNTGTWESIAPGDTSVTAEAYAGIGGGMSSAHTAEGGGRTATSVFGGFGAGFGGEDHKLQALQLNQGKSEVPEESGSFARAKVSVSLFIASFELSSKAFSRERKMDSSYALATGQDPRQQGASYVSGDSDVTKGFKVSFFGFGYEATSKYDHATGFTTYDSRWTGFDVVEGKEGLTNLWGGHVGLQLSGSFVLGTTVVQPDLR